VTINLESAAVALRDNLTAAEVAIKAAQDALATMVETPTITPPPSIRRGYAAPVGNVSRRNDIWPGDWIEVTGYNTVYNYGHHTGADLNLNEPWWDADRHRPVYSIADGEIYAIRTGVSGWGTVICIRHADCLSRYAHCENISKRQGESVGLRDYLGNIGNASGRWAYHLHFDIARLDARMLDYPLDWPGRAHNAKERVERDYYDPALFLRGVIE